MALGQAYKSLGKYSEAIANVDKAIDLFQKEGNKVGEQQALEFKKQLK